MQFENVALEAICHRLPDEIVTSLELERRLEPAYARLGLREGRLELMSGIRARRFWPAGTRPGAVSADVAAAAVARAGIDVGNIGCLIHASVSRDYLEPATACSVHCHLGLPGQSMAFDLSNACLGFLNGMVIAANMIELGQIRAAVVVGTESSRTLVETTIAELNAARNLTRDEAKLAFASLTIGSGSAAAVLVHRSLSRTGNRLMGGVFRAATEHHRLCHSNSDAGFAADTHPRMRTDSEAMLHAGCRLAKETWDEFTHALGLSVESIDRYFCHQVGVAHRRMLQQTLGLDPSRDFPTVEWLGNMGSVAMPISASIANESGMLQAGETFALLGIGSGLNSIMLAGQWMQAPLESTGRHVANSHGAIDASSLSTANSV